MKNTTNILFVVGLLTMALGIGQSYAEGAYDPSTSPSSGVVSDDPATMGSNNAGVGEGFLRNRTTESAGIDSVDAMNSALKGEIVSINGDWVTFKDTVSGRERTIRVNDRNALNNLKRGDKVNINLSTDSQRIEGIIKG